MSIQLGQPTLCSIPPSTRVYKVVEKSSHSVIKFKLCWQISSVCKCVSCARKRDGPPSKEELNLDQKLKIIKAKNEGKRMRFSDRV